jgi:hypothetical protein
MMQQQEQNPIVVEVASQPPVTPGISYGGILGSAALMAVAILFAALVVGLVVGGGVIWFKKRKEKTGAVSGPTHVRLQI